MQTRSQAKAMNAKRAKLVPHPYAFRFTTTWDGRTAQNLQLVYDTNKLMVIRDHENKRVYVSELPIYAPTNKANAQIMIHLHLLRDCINKGFVKRPEWMTKKTEDISIDVEKIETITDMNVEEEAPILQANEELRASHCAMIIKVSFKFRWCDLHLGMRKGSDTVYFFSILPEMLCFP